MYRFLGVCLNRASDPFDHLVWPQALLRSQGERWETRFRRKGSSAVDSESDRLNDSLGTIGDSELVVDAGEVVLDGLL